MATLKIYSCSKCGYNVEGTPHGHYTMSTGEFFMFHCHNCAEIVALSAKELFDAGFELACPECGQTGDLYTWNPTDGVCPKCGIPMDLDESITIMAD